MPIKKLDATAISTDPAEGTSVFWELLTYFSLSRQVRERSVERPHCSFGTLWFAADRHHSVYSGECFRVHLAAADGPGTLRQYSKRPLLLSYFLGEA
jgi:hypothetical protein